MLALTSVISSLPPASLTAVTNALRRDITTHYISRLMAQPTTVEISSTTTLTGDSEHRLTVVLDPPDTGALTSRIHNLSAVLDFLNEYLFPYLPAPLGFPASLSRPLSSALLSDLLIPSLPSDAEGLPAFLELVDSTVEFEHKYIGELLGDVGNDTDIKTWASAIPSHYERKRRVEILEHTRALVVHEDGANSTFRVRVAVPVAVTPELNNPVPSEPEPEPEAKRESSPEEAAWGFNEDDSKDAAVDEDGWGFEDEEPAPPAPTPAPAPEADSEDIPVAQEDDPGDAWGWNDNDEDATPVDEGESTDSSAWDDPWGDPEPATQPQIVSPSKPKAATRLEKLSNKGKRTFDAPPVQSPVLVPPPPPTPAMFASVQSPPQPQPQPPRTEQESYLVSARTKELVALVEAVLAEAEDLTASGTLTPYAATSSSPVGHILSQTATQVLELYRALYPVAAAAKLAGSPKQAMSFSNDCMWLSDQVQQISSRKTVPAATSQKLIEDGEIFKLLSESWYDDAIVRGTLRGIFVSRLLIFVDVYSTPKSGK